MSSRQRRNKFGQQFIMHPRELRESVAWRYLPDNGRRVLDRLELEHMQHGGLENGALPCTYDDFAEAGIRRPSVALALRQCVALGFLEITQRGGRSRAENRWPSKYRLTYVQGAGKSGMPTHDWNRIKTKDEAEAALRFAAISNSDRRVRKRNTVGMHGNVPTAAARPGTKTCLQS
jgi:hypothetical protein